MGLAGRGLQYTFTVSFAILGIVPVLIRPPSQQNLQAALPTIKVTLELSKSVAVLTTHTILRLLKSKVKIVFNAYKKHFDNNVFLHGRKPKVLVISRIYHRCWRLMMSQRRNWRSSTKHLPQNSSLILTSVSQPPGCFQASR